MGRCLYFTTLIFSVSYQLIPLCHSFEWDKQSSPLQNVRSIITSLFEEAHSCLVSTVGEKRVNLCLKFLQSGVKWLSDAVALALNTVIQYVVEILESAGIDAKLPFQKVTPEGVIFVTQWALLAVIAYWILSFILRLVVGAVRQALWLLKITFAVGMFGLILSDTGASAETTAMRLAGLACVCVLLGIGATSAKPDTHLENKIKVLERRLKEMEKSKME
ncbi:voltage-gated monoatomic cation channel TMEM109-like isoform X1 [Chanodichthys erythropterus]|uniref:voltage-gated monoatomic cation channel TMEM109-like isoform X1 n=1 Tax=Chanodichthys erythropterus TaxID=933992 RepID=UPI00351E1449